ncbi:MAG: FecR domain-containing protein [Verrucomicrobia bacterium]|nr:FecR domain-containing protein [Verrucomicrobiota bacterium]
MIAHDRLIAYVSGTLATEERARLEEQFAGDEAALCSVLDQERMDAALRAMLGGAAEREQVKQAILEVVSGTNHQDIKSSVMHEIAAPRFSFLQWLAGWRGVLAGGLTAAACAVLAFVLWPHAETAPTGFAQLGDVRSIVIVVRDGNELAARDGTALQPGDAIRVGDGASATVRFADRTRLALAARTELQLGSGDGAHQLQLLVGRLAARVAKQPADRPLTIRTSLATTRVVGTEFTLDAAPSATRIEVSEGLVKMAHSGVDSTVEVAGGEFALAVPQSELVAGLLPAKQATTTGDMGGRDPAMWPFASDSPWNRPIGSGATYADVLSPALNLAGNGGCVRPAAHFRPFFVAKPGDPQQRIVSRYQDEVFVTTPVPAEALRDGGDWVNCTLIDPTRAMAYELTGARRQGDRIETMLCTPIQLRGSGVGGNLFSGLPAVAGIIRAGELKHGIRHALCVSVLHAGLNRRGSSGGPFVWPARHMPIEEKKLTQMGNAGNVHYGTLLALPRDLDLATLGIGSSGRAFEIARALQSHGAYVTHSMPGGPATGDWKLPHVQFIADLPGETDWQKLDADVSRIVRHLKIVTSNTR